jgi:hypothetical protein
MRPKAGAKAPKLLNDRRKIPYTKTDVTKRDWSKNRLGQAFLKMPEPMTKDPFYSHGENGPVGSYGNHKLLEQKITKLIKARPFLQYGLTFWKGHNSKSYCIRIRGTVEKKPVFIRVDKPEIKKAMDFLFNQKMQ